MSSLRYQEYVRKSRDKVSLLSHAAQACKERIQELEAKTVEQYKSEILAAARNLQATTADSQETDRMNS